MGDVKPQLARPWDASSGGATVDTQARTAFTGTLTVPKNAGLVKAA